MRNDLVEYAPAPPSRSGPHGAGDSPNKTVPLDQAQRLLDLGLPLQAQRVLQGAAQGAPGAERALWDGLARLASGVTQARRGNAAGAIALIRRGLEALPAEDATVLGIDARGLRKWGRLSIMGLSAFDGTASLAPLRLRAAADANVEGD